MLIGETVVHDVETLATFYGTGVDELHLAFNFVFVDADFDADVSRRCVAKTEELMPRRAWPVWTTRQPRRRALPDALGGRRRAAACGSR